MIDKKLGNFFGHLSVRDEERYLVLAFGEHFQEKLSFWKIDG